MRRPVWSQFVFASALLVVTPVQGQKASIDSYVRSEMKYEGIPGVALGLYDHGRAIQIEGFGLANAELRIPVQPRTVFASGSLAKQFVAAAVMMLVEEGKLQLGDNIDRYFPDAPASWKLAKIENLLSHTSGLGDFSTVELTGRGASFDFRQDFTQQQLLKKFFALPVAFAPGSSWAYCNTNYVLIG